MQSLSTGLSALVADLGPEAAQALKRARNKERYRAAVERTWRARPEVARFVLEHTNGIYIARDDRPRKGPAKDRDWWVFGMYLDDPAARTEVDAWQSVLLQALRAEGITVDELRFLPAKWDMRKRKLFPVEEETGAHAARATTADSARTVWREEDESRGLDIVKTAACLVFGDVEQAWAFLEQVRGAVLDEVLLREPNEAGSRRDGKVQGEKWYWLVLYVDDVQGMQRIVDAYGDALRSQARRLGLRIRKVAVREAPPALAGCRSFRRQGRSVPLRSLGAEMPSLSPASRS
ncbi:hypothetical protein VIN30_09975 [Adlercreutzia sp. R7]|uniref:Uncharacterized protein n=1 Tax=Adlercreutzia wanghongyangiae TaxID=3111451 RepID=A0ABU6IJX3_9ACTN|nr:hypothetical protein [Adlercreutzia sp. R7]